MARPALLALSVCVLLAIFTDAASEPLALIMFTFAAFTLAAVAQEFWRGAVAQRSLSGGSLPRSLVAVVGRNRRRYGGYVVHAGLAILFIAVAASSSFQTSRDLRLRPGDSAQVGDYTVTYERPSSAINPTEERLTFGAVLEVTKDGRQFARLSPSRNYYSSQAVDSVQGFFEGEATSEVGRKGGPGGDFWTAMRPDLTSFDGAIQRADRRVAQGTDRIVARAAAQIGSQPPPAMREAVISRLQGAEIVRLSRLYLKDPPPVDFRVNVNPLVIWLWIGGAIAVAGGLIAIWPAPAARRRRVSDVYAARLARDLGRA